MSEYATRKQADRLFADVKKLQEQMQTLLKQGTIDLAKGLCDASKISLGIEQQSLFSLDCFIKTVPYIPETKPKHWETDTIAMKAKRIQLLHTEIEVVRLCAPGAAIYCNLYKELKSGLVYHESELLPSIGEVANLICKQQAETKKLLVKGILKL